MSVTRINRFVGQGSKLVVFMLCCLSLWVVSMFVPTVWRAAGSAVPAPLSQLRVTGFGQPGTKVGQRVEIQGSGFDTNSPHQNHVYFTNSQTGDLAEALFDPAVQPTGSTLAVITPYDAMSGFVQVRVGAIGAQCAPCTPCAPCTQSATQLSVETSFSGIVQDSGSCCGIEGVTVSVSGLPGFNGSTTTTANGVFVFSMVSTIQGTQLPAGLNYWVDGTAVHSCYVKKQLPTALTAGADVYNGVITLRSVSASCKIPKKKDCCNQTVASIGANKGASKPNLVAASATGVKATRNTLVRSSSFVVDGQSPTASVQTEAIMKIKGKDIRAGEVVLQIPNGALRGKLKLDVFESERTPVRLPRKFFSSTIVQIAPFGIRIEPGAKLIFPNRDKIRKDRKARLFRFDQEMGSKTLGTFVEAGWATVSADEKLVETGAGAIKETGYYFVSDEWPTETLTGHVQGSDGRPVLGAIVIARGQFIYTKGNGDFQLPDVPAVESGVPAIVKVTLLRPDGVVITKEFAGVPITVGGDNKVPDVVLPPRPVNHPPEFSTPSSFTIRAGETRNLTLKVSELNNEKKARVFIEEPKPGFATVIFSGILWCRDYRLRLAPQAKDVGEHKLTLTAVDSLRVSTSHTISVKVIPR